MPITNADLTTNTFTLDPMLLTDTQKTLVTNIIHNIQLQKDMTDTLATESQTKFNEVIDSVNALQDGTSVSITELQEKIDAILFLESEAGNDSFVGAFTKLFNVINDRKETDAFALPVTDSKGGVVNIDLTPYGFTSLSEFEVFPQVVTDVSGKNIDVTFHKDTVTNGILTLRDGDRLSFSDNAESYYDATVKGAVTVTVIVVKTATPIVADLVEVDGDEVHLGHDVSDHNIDAITELTSVSLVDGSVPTIGFTSTVADSSVRWEIRDEYGILMDDKTRTLVGLTGEYATSVGSAAWNSDIEATITSGGLVTVYTMNFTTETIVVKTPTQTV